MAIVKIHETKLDSLSGDAVLKELSEDAGRKCVDRWFEDPNCVYRIYDSKLELDVAKYIMSHGGEVDKFALYIEIQDESDLVPLGVLGAMSQDGEDVQLSWSQWTRHNCEILIRDGRKFIGTQCCYIYPPKDGHLPMSELVPVFDDLVKIEDVPVTEETLP